MGIRILLTPRIIVSTYFSKAIMNQTNVVGTRWIHNGYMNMIYYNCIGALLPY